MALALALPAAAQPSSATATAEVADLMDVFRSASRHDALLRKSRADRQAVEAVRGEAVAALLPSIAARVTRQETRYVSPSLRDSDVEYWSVNVSQELFSLPAFHGIGQVNANIEQSRALWQRARQDLMLRVASAYFEQLRAASNLHSARAEEQALAQQLDQAQQRFSVGLVPVVDVQDARASHSLSIADRLSRDADLARANEKLHALAGQRYPHLAPLSERYLPSVPPAAREWVANAPQRSPWVQSFYHAMRAAAKNAKVKRAARWPTLAVSWTYTESLDQRRDGADDFFSGVQDGHRVVFNADIPVFSGGALSSSANQARRQHQAAQHEYEQTRRDVVEQVRSLFLELRIGESRVKAFAQALVAAESAADAVRAGYRVGTRNVVDVLNVQNQRFRAERDHASARHDFVLSLLRLRMQAGVLALRDLQEVNRWLADPVARVVYNSDSVPAEAPR